MEGTIEWINTQTEKKYAKTDTIPASQLLTFLSIFKDETVILVHDHMEQSLERLRREQEYYQEKLEERLEAILQQIFQEIQGLAALLEQANNGELPPSDEIAELAGRLLALEKTVAGMQARQAVS